MDVYTRIDPGEWVHLRHCGAIGATIAAGGSSAVGNEARPGEVAAEPSAAETAIGERAVTSAAADTLSPIWKYGWAKRGWEIDKLFRDGSLPPVFRTIDNFTSGVATSVKSIDLNATTYQEAARLTYRLDQYAEKMGEYEGGILLNTEVKLSDITERVINLVVPKGAMTQARGN